MRVVILVPRRDGFPERDRTWRWVRGWWTANLPEFPIVEGHHHAHEGLFCRSAALNRAADAAGDWDVALIIDSDIICDPEHVREAVRRAALEGTVAVPFTVRHNLDRLGSEKVMAGYTGPWEPYIARNFFDQHSSVIAVPRTVWQTVGGFDETFRGWGMEDTAFCIAATVLVRPWIHMEGECWHLWHRSAPEGHRNTPSSDANRARGARYQAALAANDADAIRALQAEGRPQVAVAAAGPGLPRILHRVVPERIDEQAERWWAEFAAMHPGWELRTHRDPLDPAAWSLTSPWWHRCRNGAELADLVRLEALLRWGGIYVDEDVQPFRPLDPLLPLSAFAAWEDERTVPNAVMGAAPDHPAIRACLDLAIERIDRPTWDRGPGVTTAVLPGRADVLLLPPGSFYAVHYRDPARAAKMADPKLPARQPWAFVLHHYAGSWLPARAAS